MSRLRSTNVSVSYVARGDGSLSPIGCAAAGPVSEFVALHALGVHLVDGEAPAAIGACLDPVVACSVHVA